MSTDKYEGVFKRLEYSGGHVYIVVNGEKNSIFHQSKVTDPVDPKIRLTRYDIAPMLSMGVGQSFKDKRGVGDPKYTCTRVSEDVFEFEFDYIKHYGEKIGSEWERINEIYQVSVNEIERLVLDMVLDDLEERG